MGSSSSSPRRSSPATQQPPQRGAAPPPGASVAARQPPPPVTHQNQPRSQAAPHRPPQQQGMYPASHMGPRAPPPQHQATAQVHAEVKDAKNVVALCSVHTKSIKMVESCLYFEITTEAPLCSYEIHVAVRETIRKGDVVYTPNRPKQAPEAVTIEGNHDCLELVFPLELDDVSEQEKKYLKEYPKQIPVTLVVRYVTPNGEQMAEHTYIQLLPTVAAVKQLVVTKDGVFKVENLFGADEDDGTAVAVVAGSDSPTPASPAAGVLDDDDGDECVICLTNPKDTAVIPCRHLCLCKDCAEPLRRQSPKCPVCRGPIEQLLHIGPKH